MVTELSSKKLSPHSLEAEEAVCGGILVNADGIHDVNFLSPAHFYLQQLGWIFQAIMNLKDRQDPIDFLMVCSELEQMGKLEKVGGQAYVLSLVNRCPDSYNVQGYGRIVERMALRRRFIAAAQEVAMIAHSAETDIDEVCNRSERAILDVVAQRKVSTRITAEEADRRLDEQEEYGSAMATEFQEFDEVTDYQVRCGRSLHIMGASGHMKTTIAQQLLADWALRGFPCLFVSMENPAEDIKDQMNRYVSWRLRCTVEEARKKLSRENGVRLEFLSGRQSASDIEAHVMAMTYGGQERGVVVVDTIQKLKDCDKGRGTDQAAVASGSAALDAVRLRTKSLFVILCQQYVGTNEKNYKMLRPSRANVKDSKAIFQDARIMVGTYYADDWRHEYGSDFEDPGCGKGEVMIRCLKNTYGDKRRVTYAKLAVIPSIPAVVSPSMLAKPVQQTFAAAAHPNGNGYEDLI